MNQFLIIIPELQRAKRDSEAPWVRKTHQGGKIWLWRQRRTERPNVRPYVPTDSWGGEGRLKNIRLTETCGAGLPCTLILDIHAMINCHLLKQGICWQVSRDHIAGSSVQLIVVTLTKCWFLIGSRAHVRLTSWNQDRIVWKLVNASPGSKFVQNITFYSIQMFFAALFLLLCFDYKIQKVKQ